MIKQQQQRQRRGITIDWQSRGFSLMLFVDQALCLKVLGGGGAITGIGYALWHHLVAK